MLQILKKVFAKLPAETSYLLSQFAELVRAAIANCSKTTKKTINEYEPIKNSRLSTIRKPIKSALFPRRSTRQAMGERAGFGPAARGG